MNLFGLMETSGSAMQAERMRAEVVAANMANAETTRTESGGPYRRHEVVFAANPDDNSFADALNGAAGGTFPAPPLPLNPLGLHVPARWPVARRRRAHCGGSGRSLAAAAPLRPRPSRRRARRLRRVPRH